MSTPLTVAELLGLPELQPYKTRIDLEGFASRIGLTRGYLGYLRRILQGNQAASLKLSTSAAEFLDKIFEGHLVVAMTDAESTRIEAAVTEIGELLGCNKDLLEEKFAEMAKSDFDSFANEVITTLKRAGWHLVHRSTSNTVGTSIYLKYTTDGAPPDEDYEWDLSDGWGGGYQYGVYDRREDIQKSFRFDPRYCKVRISDHGGGDIDIGVSIVIFLGSASCKVLKARPRDFGPGEFGGVFDGFIRPKFSPGKKK